MSERQVEPVVIEFLEHYLRMVHRSDYKPGTVKDLERQVVDMCEAWQTGNMRKPHQPSTFPAPPFLEMIRLEIQDEALKSEEEEEKKKVGHKALIEFLDEPTIRTTGSLVLVEIKDFPSLPALKGKVLKAVFPNRFHKKLAEHHVGNEVEVAGNLEPSTREPGTVVLVVSGWGDEEPKNMVTLNDIKSLMS